MELPYCWHALLQPEPAAFAALSQRVEAAYAAGTVYPPRERLFAALEATPPAQVRCVILGQDPYHEPGQAHGLAFSVREGTVLPPSLVNMLRELNDDLGISMADKPNGPDSSRGVLDPWARQGVLLLNTVLTVRAHQAGSHRGKGWERFTDRVIELIAERETPAVFVLWGANAGAKKDLILRAQGDRLRHLVITAPHPSPLSAYRGFFGGCYYSRCNYFLEDNGLSPIDWSL